MFVKKVNLAKIRDHLFNSVCKVKTFNYLVNWHVNCKEKEQYADRFREKYKRIYPKGIIQHGIRMNKAVNEGKGSANDCDEFDDQQKQSR